MKIFKAIIYAILLILWVSITATVILPYFINAISNEEWFDYFYIIFDELKKL